jgi:hypothetical protein
MPEPDIQLRMKAPRLSTKQAVASILYRSSIVPPTAKMLS